MKTIRVYQFNHLAPMLLHRLKEAQMEAAQVWNCCMEMHKQARLKHTRWPGRNDLQQVTKGHFALHSQSVQMVTHAFLSDIDTTRELRKTHPHMQMKYPWRTKRFYPVHWPAQAVSVEAGRVILPMGRGRPSIVLQLSLPAESGACTLVWNHGFELHVCIEIARAEQAPGENQAAVDLGEIHLAAVTTNMSAALIVTGRGIRSLKHQRNKQLRNQDKGRHHNQRMSLWEYGRDIDYLTHKAKQAHIMSFTGSERGTSSRCPVCGHKHKPKGRNWVCRACGFAGHRDLVGSVNMHLDAFGTHLKFPRSFTYLRPSSSRAGTPQRCLSESAAQPLLVEQVSSETGHTADGAQKPVRL